MILQQIHMSKMLVDIIVIFSELFYMQEKIKPDKCRVSHM